MEMQPGVNPISYEKPDAKMAGYAGEGKPEFSRKRRENQRV
jgi:hypothetical protein